MWIHVALTWKIMIQSGHNFAHATTAQLLWHVQNCYLIGSLEPKLVQKVCPQKFQLWTHKPLVKWVPQSHTTPGGLPAPQYLKSSTQGKLMNCMVWKKSMFAIAETPIRQNTQSIWIWFNILSCLTSTGNCDVKMIWRCEMTSQYPNDWSIVFQNEIPLSNVVPYKCKIPIWNWINTDVYLVSTVGTDGLVL